jgi:hypothetical protein
MPDPPPDPNSLKDLAAWRPPLGVISVYLRTDPADRRQTWRTVLKDSLHQIAESDPDRKRELRVAADQIEQRFDEMVEIDGRCQAGYLEVSEPRGKDLRPGDGREQWFSLQAAPKDTEIVYRERPALLPMMELLDDGAPVGAVAVSSEYVRLVEWALGDISETGSWEPEAAGQHWHERYPNEVHERLDSEGSHFLREAGARIEELTRGRGWRAVLGFGDKPEIEELAKGFSNDPKPRFAEQANIVHAPLEEIRAKTEEALEAFNRQREAKLAQRAIDAALSAEGRGCLGVADTSFALREARVEHLLLGDGVEPGDADELIEAALNTDAAVTPLDGEAAAMLDEHGGAGAILRY